LAAILFPVFARARENARRASCQSNLKQIGLGVMQYTQDYDEIYPRLTKGWYSFNTDKWMDDIMPYVKSTQLFTCPSDSASNRLFVHPASARTNYSLGSYGWNNTYQFPGDPQATSLWRFNGPESSRAAALAQIEAPATTVMAADFGNGNHENGGLSDNIPWNTWETVPNVNTTNNPRTLGSIVERHLETTVVLFADGHVKSLRLDVLNRRKADNSQIQPMFTTQDD
jgi:prepilin-type processing-associated H-X9-DG protein